MMDNIVGTPLARLFGQTSSVNLTSFFMLNRVHLLRAAVFWVICSLLTLAAAVRRQLQSLRLPTAAGTI
jgi:hypothetical protein